LGDSIRIYSIELNVDGKVEKKVIEYPVVACKEYNDYSKNAKRQGQYVVLDTNNYKVLQTLDEEYATNSILEKAHVWEMKWSSRTFKDYVNASIYTTEIDEKKAYKKLKKEIEKYLKKEYGRYGNYLDLLSKIEI
jgi:hypothetical protein